MSAIVVAALHVYPIKSLRGVALDEATIDRRGIRLDRRWMVVDRDGEYMTQRAHRAMAKVDVRIADDSLYVSVPSMPVLVVPFDQARGDIRRVTIWDDTCDARIVSDAASSWFSEILGVPCDLVFMPDDVERPVDPRYARADDRVGFADGYPFLLASESSLGDLNRRLDAPIPMIRFRPNIVVSGAEAFAEDTWSMIAIGDVSFRVVKPCARCVITTVDPETAEAGKEPLRTLAKFRRDANNDVLFAQNMVHDREGTIRVGDRVTVLSAHRVPQAES